MSEPVGIDCGATCAAVFDADVQVFLIPVAGDDGVVDIQWNGCDPGGDIGLEGCIVTMDADKTVTAFFESAPALQSP